MPGGRTRSGFGRAHVFVVSRLPFKLSYAFGLWCVHSGIDTGLDPLLHFLCYAHSKCCFCGGPLDPLDDAVIPAPQNTLKNAVVI